MIKRCACYALLLSLAVFVFVVFRKTRAQETQNRGEREQVRARDFNDSSKGRFAKFTDTESGKRAISPRLDADLDKLRSFLTNDSASSYNEAEIFGMLLTEARRDPQWAFDALLQSRNLRVSGYFGRVLKEISESDPALFQQCIRSLDPKTRIRTPSKFLGGICAVLSEDIHDPNNLSLIGKLYENFRTIDDEYIKNIAASDPGKALEMVSAIPVSLSVKSAMKGAVASTLALADRLAEAVDLVKADIGSGKLETTYNTALYHIFSKNPMAIPDIIHVASAGALNQMALTPELVGLIADKGSIEDKRNFLSRVALTDSNKAAHATLIASIFATSPGDGLAQLNALPRSGARNEMMGTCFSQLASIDPDGARRLLGQVVQDDVPIATKAVAKSIAQADWNAGLEFAARSSDHLKPEIYREIAETGAMESPLDAVKFLEDPGLSAIVGEAFRGRMLDLTVQSWANQDLDAARQWVEQLKRADKANGVRGLMTPWMKSDPIAASDWLSKQSPGSARDAGARVIIEQIENTDPGLADQWRKSLSPSVSGNEGW